MLRYLFKIWLASWIAKRIMGSGHKQRTTARDKD